MGNSQENDPQRLNLELERAKRTLANLQASHESLEARLKLAEASLGKIISTANYLKSTKLVVEEAEYELL